MKPTLKRYLECNTSKEKVEILKEAFALIDRQRELLEKFIIGFKWNIDNIPEMLDKADYEFYDEVLNQLKDK